MAEAEATHRIQLKHNAANDFNTERCILPTDHEEAVQLNWILLGEAVMGNLNHAIFRDTPIVEQ